MKAIGFELNVLSIKSRCFLFLMWLLLMGIIFRKWVYIVSLFIGVLVILTLGVGLFMTFKGRAITGYNYTTVVHHMNSTRPTTFSPVPSRSPKQDPIGEPDEMKTSSSGQSRTTLRPRLPSVFSKTSDRSNTPTHRATTDMITSSSTEQASSQSEENTKNTSNEVDTEPENDGISKPEGSSEGRHATNSQ